MLPLLGGKNGLAEVFLSFPFRMALRRKDALCKTAALNV